jgi:hypothetical protein
MPRPACPQASAEHITGRFTFSGKNRRQAGQPDRLVLDYGDAMPNDDLISRVFRTVDGTDPAAFVEFFTPDGRLTFANEAPMVGHAAMVEGLTAFYGTIGALHHKIVNSWTVDTSTIIETAVTYDRLDDRSVTIPVVTIWHTTAAGLIDDYRVFFNLDPVYAP